ncbi:MAG: hypothetical protein G01um10148_173 [Parcubacteria group bacterium Gr01-1014_8]|nr:MAG: hypothetical protein G01um10148_173 [Parcubacteria group bacterium Gr01-1014_8]
MTVTPPPGNKKDPYREDHGLDAAKKKLDEITGRPFDVIQVLATHRAKEERGREKEKEIQHTLETTIEKARRKRQEKEARQAEENKRATMERELRDIKRREMKLPRPEENKPKE